MRCGSGRKVPLRTASWMASSRRPWSLASAARVAASDKVSTDSSAQVEAATTAARSALGNKHDLRLSEIAAAVRNGTFKPDPQRIAQKILDDAELTAMLQTMLQRG